jgi:hypothetical protein
VYNHPLLKVLKLNNCNLPDHLLAFLIETTICQHPSLEEIELKGNSCQEQSLLALARALTKTTSNATNSHPDNIPLLSKRLSALSVTNKELSEDPVPGLMEFCRALHMARSLTYLSMGEYMLHEFDMKALVDSMGFLPSIRNLSLLTCGMTAQSIHRLCHDGLQHNKIPSLRALSIPEDASDALATALKQNTSLERLLMEGRTGAHTYYLDLNRGGRRLLQEVTVRDPSVTPAIHLVSPSLWPLVLCRAMYHKSNKYYYGGEGRHLDVLYCLLRNLILLET